MTLNIRPIAIEQNVGDFTFPGIKVSNAGIDVSPAIILTPNTGEEVVFNEIGLDIDFRVEGIGSNNLFKIDAGNNRVGIGGIPAIDFHIFGQVEIEDTTFPQLFIDATNDWQLGDSGGNFIFKNSTANIGSILFRRSDNQTIMTINLASGIQVNPSQNSAFDFRVLTPNETHMLFIDAGTEEVGIGESSPQARLHVTTPGSASSENALAIENPSVASSADTSLLGVIDGATRSSITFQRSGVTSAGIILLKANDSGGVSQRAMDINGDNVIVNAAQIAAMDFIVRGDNLTELLFVDAGVETVKTGGGRIVNTTRVTTTYTILVTDHVILCDTDGGAFTVTLPAGVEGQMFRVINVGTSGNNVTIDGDGAETVMGSATQALQDGEILILVYNATEGWW